MNTSIRKEAYYFGCITKGKASGHYLYNVNGNSIRDPRSHGLAWSLDMMDGGLLKNGKHPDIYDGKVFCVPATEKRIAFFWWDRSGDPRGASNSGFYVKGFDWNDRQSAFNFACKKFPQVEERQKHPLTLQEARRWYEHA